MSLEIRLALPADSAAIQAIYAPYCGESTVSFELTPPTVDEMRERVVALAPAYPWIVCQRGGEIVAYAYAGPHHVRAAYAWSVNTSVYVAPAAQRNGIGRGVYRSLLELLKLQGFVNAVALISVPHPASSRLHAAMGFERAGLYRHVGYKAGRWIDVKLWQKQLAPLPEHPIPPLSIARARALPGWPGAMAAGAGEIRLRSE